MSQTADGTAEPLKWPIAPDGYIPNSIIRNWMRKEEELTKMDVQDDIFISHDWVDEYTADDEDDISSRTFWFIEDEEEEEEDYVKVWEVEKEDEINERDKGKEKVAEKKDREEKKMDRIVLVDQFYDVRTKNQLNTLGDGEVDVAPRSQEVTATYRSTKTVNVQPTSCQENGPKALRDLREDLREDLKLHGTVTPPLQHLSVPNNQRASSFIPKEAPVEGPVVSADTVIPKREPRITLYMPPTEPKNGTSHPLKSPSPTPEEPQPQPDLTPPPIIDKRNLLYSAKYNNITDQAQVPLDRKVLELFKKIKAGNKNSSHSRKLSITAKRQAASLAQTNSGGLNLSGGLYSPQTFGALQSRANWPNSLGNAPDYRAALSTIQTQPPSNIHPEYPSYQQLAQTTLPIHDQRGLEAMPEWRKSLYEHISLQGFCSPQAARLAITEHLGKSSNAGQPPTIYPSLQPGQAPLHQRVVQRIQMTHVPEPTSSHFHCVIPVASRHNFITMNLCGETQYGRLQFDWVRGSEEDARLKVSGVKNRETAA